MEGFQLFMILSFLVYLQAGLYVFWKSPFVGLNLWFSFSTFLFALWSAAYVFSETGEAGGQVFPLIQLTLNGLAFLPAFVLRVFFSIYRFPANVIARNGLFAGMLIAGMLALLFIHQGLTIQRMEETGLFSTWQTLLPVHAVFLMLHLNLFPRLHFSLLKPGRLLPDIIDNTSHIILLCDASFRIIYLNNYTQKILGFNESNTFGKTLWSLFDIPDQAKKAALEELGKNQVAAIDARLIAVEGHAIHIQADIFKVTDIYKDLQGYALAARVTDYERQLKNEMRECDSSLNRINGLIREVDEGVSNYSKRLADIYRQQAVRFSASKRIDEMIFSDIQERELLVVEIHQRVISNMEFIIWLIEQYRKDKFTGTQAGKVENLHARIYAILTVHKHLYFALYYSDVDFKAFVYELTAHLSEKYDGVMRAGIRLTIPEHFIEIDKALPLGLIISELIINAYLHAFPAREDSGMRAVDPVIEISLVTTDDGFMMMVADNGHGLPAPLDQYTEADGGLALVDILVKGQLGGAWSYRYAHGAIFQVLFV